MLQTPTKFIPALRFKILTPLFDPFLQLTVRELTIKRRLVEQMGIEEGHRILDIGCGTATLTILIKRTYPDAEIIGIDIDPKILEIARLKVQKAGMDIRLDQGSIFELPYADNSFDRTASSLVIHHITHENKVRAFKEIFRILKPGGEMHIADFGKSQNAIMYLISSFLGLFEDTSDNIHGLLPQMFREAGFEQVEETARYATMLGTISLYKTRKPGYSIPP